MNLKSGESVTYFLTNNDKDTLSIEQGMCAGACRYHEKLKYQVRFSLMDICGNKNNEWPAWIEFDSPFEQGLKR
jgi:hypothetical protein